MQISINMDRTIKISMTKKKALSQTTGRRPLPFPDKLYFQQISYLVVNVTITLF